MVNIKVAVRIRPLSHRELIRRDDVIVRKENEFILVTNPKIPEGQNGDSRQRTRRFAVDFCYDPSEAESCSQEAVYGEIGLEVLDSLFDGYNACVLAYGHSASGKTYTIMGLQDDPGLTPRLCQGLFEKMEDKSEKIQFQVFVSFLEIYNEKVRDLLGGEEASGAPSNFSLRVREHPKLGPYVQGLSQHLVRDKRKLLGLLAVGNRRRSTAATENNAHSSRSHAVFTIYFKQSDGENYETEKLSKVHLVDLAGSLQEGSQSGQLNERASSAQSKARLKEGANINKSLVTLGNVISALADNYEAGGLLKEQSASKAWQPFVPYRDSVLTWLLKDTLGGNSNTIMIATVSPASGCLSETINTLRYAKRTKRIVNRPIVNEDPKIRTIRELKEEIARLRELLLCFQTCRAEAATQDEFPDWGIGPSRPRAGFPITLSKCLDRGGTQFTDGLKHFSKEENSRESEEDVKNEDILENSDEKKKQKLTISRVTVAEATKGNKRAVRTSGAPSLRDKLCEIDDEKKSDVNGSVIDNCSHDTEFFSDSLESFSTIFIENETPTFAEDNDPGRVSNGDEESRQFFLAEAFRNLSKKQKPCLRREYSSCENLMERNLAKMLHRSRPDLIRGISTRSNEAFPAPTSQSCTDVSSPSQSTSENSLNSSGSVDAQPFENRNSPETRGKSANGSEKAAESAWRRNDKNKSFQLVSKKKDKRSEIVKSVTTRLYPSKNKPDHRTEGVKKEEKENDGEVEELKLCKRARMKLFDLSRKLAMTKRIKKTMDSDTQTDSVSGTVRVKEKSVVTDERGINFATATTPEKNLQEKNKPCMIMNQVFLPQSSNYVVKCGKNVRIESPRPPNHHEWGTQTTPDDLRESYKNANTSPIKFVSQSDDCFSDDSLDLEENARIFRPAYSEKDYALLEDSHLEERASCGLNMDRGCYNYTERSASELNAELFVGKKYLCCDFQEISRNPKKKHIEAEEPLFNGLPLSIFTRETLSGEEMALIAPASQNSLSSDSKKEENFSSENSFTSAEGTDGASSSETSSEDFMFYENPKDPGNKSKLVSNRELYTITENSEQSDASDAFSPLQSQGTSLVALETNPKQLHQAEFAQNEFQALALNDNSESTAIVGEKVEKKSGDECRESGFPAFRSVEDEGSRKECFASNEVQNWMKHPIGFSGHSKGSSESKTSEVHELSVPNLTSYPSSLVNAASNSLGKVPNSERFSSLKAPEASKNHIGSEGLNATNDRHVNDLKTDSHDSKSKFVNWTDLSSNFQKQFINLNILDTSRPSPFSVDSHLFGKTSKRDQSTDAMFTSADSITLVFMGPAKPKTSVLMEIIRRSLEKDSSSEEASSASSSRERESRSKGVQCDSSLIRSVSVDTAMIALSQIAKNQERTGEVSRTTSLAALVPDETHAILERGKPRDFHEKRCQCDLEADIFKEQQNQRETAKTWSKYSNVGGGVLRESTGAVDVNARKMRMVEKPNKSVSWSGETRYQINERDMGGQDDESIRSSNPKEVAATHFDLSYCGASEMEVEETNEKKPFGYFASNTNSTVYARRVRFLKSENTNPEDDDQKREAEETESVSAFLREATQLLRRLNYNSLKHQTFFGEVREDLTTSQNKQEENKRSPLKRRSKKLELLTRSETESCLENTSFWKSKTEVTSGEDIHQQEFPNLTWPRRGATSGKPPTGARSRFFRSPLLSRSNSNGFSSDSTRNCSQSSRMMSNGTSWNISNLSMALSNSSFKETPVRFPSSRLHRFNDSRDSTLWSSRVSSRIPRSNVAKPNFDPLSELEINLEESCRRLESVAEQDKLRQDVLESKRKMFECERLDFGRYSGSDCSEEASLAEGKEMERLRDAIKRRKTNECINGCNCTDGSKEPCTYPLLKGCRSSYELDSFGPGSKHCPQLCLFCRKGDAEMYCSAVNLNSECCPNRCRLNYYGYCPCSRVRLSHVPVSPRAYMHHLLTLRRHLVSQTKR